MARATFVTFHIRLSNFIGLATLFAVGFVTFIAAFYNVLDMRDYALKELPYSNYAKLVPHFNWIGVYMFVLLAAIAAIVVPVVTSNTIHASITR